MASSDSRKFSGTPPAANDTGNDIPTANEAGAGPARAADSLAFDPRESFYPQALLKAHDLKDSPLAVKAPERPFRPIVKVFVALVLAIAAALAYVFFLSGPTPPPGAKNTPNAPLKDPKSQASATGAITSPATSTGSTPSAASSAPAATATPKSPPPEAAPPKPAAPVAATRVPAPGSQQPVTAPARPAGGALPTYTYRPPATGQSTITHTKAAVDAAQSGVPIAPAPAAVPVAPAAPPSNARAGPCSEALAALGLCVPAAKPEEKK
jgi:hypothetical protein